MKKQILTLLQSVYDTKDGRLIDLNLENYVDKIISHAKIISIVIGGEIRAFIAYYDNDPKKELAYLTMVVVDYEYRGLGYGKNLIKMALENLKHRNFKKFKLEVHKENDQAYLLYKSLGFCLSGENDESIFMIKEIW